MKDRACPVHSSVRLNPDRSGSHSEQMDEPRADGKGAIHVVVSVPSEQARAADIVSG
jgi:hypothetical protein